MENKNVERLGSSKLTKVNFRLICATNRDLATMMKEHRFRDDLYYRINILTITVPPLKNRADDIPLIVSSILCSRKKDEIKISDTVMTILREYDWPGNIRELRGVIERAVTICENKTIEVHHLPLEIIHFNPGKTLRDSQSILFLAQEMASHEKLLIEQALLYTKGKKNKAAQLLGISRTSFYEKSRLHGINSLSDN